MKARGIIKQQIESFDYFLEVEIKKILAANQEVKAQADQNWYLKYTNIYIGEPRGIKTGEKMNELTPQICRLTDGTYSAPIKVDIEYMKAGAKFAAKNVEIGDMPIMLRSSKCVLRGKSFAEHAQLGECPLDPGGYFIIGGQEKVILMQEQLSKNRIIIEQDNKGEISATVTRFSFLFFENCFS